MDEDEVGHQGGQHAHDEQERREEGSHQVRDLALDACDLRTDLTDQVRAVPKEGLGVLIECPAGLLIERPSPRRRTSPALLPSSRQGRPASYSRFPRWSCTPPT